MSLHENPALQAGLGKLLGRWPEQIETRNGYVALPKKNRAIFKFHASDWDSTPKLANKVRYGIARGESEVLRERDLIR